MFLFSLFEMHGYVSLQFMPFFYLCLLLHFLIMNDEPMWGYYIEVESSTDVFSVLCHLFVSGLYFFVMILFLTCFLYYLFSSILLRRKLF